MLVYEEKSPKSHKRKSFEEFEESYYSGSNSEQNSKYSSKCSPQSNESIRIAFESKLFDRDS